MAFQLTTRSRECDDKVVCAGPGHLRPYYLNEQVRQIRALHRSVSQQPHHFTTIACLILLSRNSRAQNWSPSKNRFLDQSRRSRDQPGPGAYNPSDMDSNAGSYIVSNFKNTGNVKFIKPVPLQGGSALRSRTPMINRAATSKSNKFNQFLYLF